jgi:hypothetical protein
LFKNKRFQNRGEVCPLFLRPFFSRLFLLFCEGLPMPITKDQIIAAIQAAAQTLGHTPTTTEFTRLSGINDRNASRLFKTYLGAVKAAGLEPHKKGQRLSSAGLLEDWGEVARKVGWVPTRREYLREGRHGYLVFRSRFQRWVNVPKEFCRFVETGSLAGDWTDVLEKIRLGPLPKSGGGKRVMRLREAVRASRMVESARETEPVKSAETQRCERDFAGGGERVFKPDYERGVERDWAMAHPVPTAVANKKCVTATMLMVFVAELAPSALSWISGGGSTQLEERSGGAGDTGAEQLVAFCVMDFLRRGRKRRGEETRRSLQGAVVRKRASDGFGRVNECFGAAKKIPSCH